MNSKVSIGIKVIIPGCHLFWIDELCHLASARAAWLQWNMYDRLNWLWNNSRLWRLGWNGANLGEQGILLRAIIKRKYFSLCLAQRYFWQQYCCDYSVDKKYKDTWSITSEIQAAFCSWIFNLFDSWKISLMDFSLTFLYRYLNQCRVMANYWCWLKQVTANIDIEAVKSYFFSISVLFYQTATAL